MESLNNLHRTNAGFTLLEVLMVIGLISFLAGVSIFFGVDALRGNVFHSDRDVLVTALQHARAEAVSNICHGDSSVCTDGKPHGVHIEQNRFVVFQGTTYNPLDEQNASIDATDAVLKTTTPANTDIIFTQLSGDVATPVSVSLTDANGHTSVITIGSEGQISWTN